MSRPTLRGAILGVFVAGAIVSKSEKPETASFAEKKQSRPALLLVVQ